MHIYYDLHYYPGYKITLIKNFIIKQLLQLNKKNRKEEWFKVYLNIIIYQYHFQIN